MSDFLVWKPEFSVRVAAMDEQHKKVFKLINELQQALDEGRALSIAGHVFTEMSAYSQYHLGAEEQLLEKHGFPSLAEHKLKHEILVRRLMLFKQSYDEGKASVIPVSLLSFLREWWTKHILEADQRYSEFLNSQGVY
jgi:hemerythrin